jgi:4-carboxymuconolactone decarboxylase
VGYNARYQSSAFVRRDFTHKEGDPKMQFKSICFAVLGFAAMAAAQTATAPDLHLRGDRFRPLTYSELTPQQKVLADHVIAGDRGSLNGPYNVFLRSPEMGDLAQSFGAYTRFHSAVPKKLNEFAIIITSRFWNSQYEWLAHSKYAADDGLSQDIIEAVANGKRPASMQPDEEAVYNFCTELIDTRQVSDKTFEVAKSKLGEQGVVDLIAVMGYYDLVAMTLNVDRYPLPIGATPGLKPLK